jgi:hypothetical protein
MRRRPGRQHADERQFSRLRAHRKRPRGRAAERRRRRA